MAVKYFRNPITGEMALAFVKSDIPVPTKTLRGIVARRKGWTHCLRVTKQEFEFSLNRGTAPTDYTHIEVLVGTRQVKFKEGEGLATLRGHSRRRKASANARSNRKGGKPY